VKRQQAEAAATFTVDDSRGHDLRRTAASMMASGGIPRLTISKLLNHVERTVTAVYDRHATIRRSVPPSIGGMPSESDSQRKGGHKFAVCQGRLVASAERLHHGRATVLTSYPSMSGLKEPAWRKLRRMSD
jgi:hypothetical protein